MYISKRLFFTSISVSLPIYNPRYAHTHTHKHTLVHELLTLEHSDKQMSLWLVWSCGTSQCVYRSLHFFKKTRTQKKLTPSNGIENSFPMMDDVIYFLCICEYIYIYIPKHTVYCVRVSHTYALDCVYRCKVTFRSVMWSSVGRHQ